MADEKERTQPPKCMHRLRRPMTGCTAVDITTGESNFKCLECGQQGTHSELGLGFFEVRHEVQRG